MKNKDDLVKFNMTEVMSSSLIEFNKLKQELNKSKQEYDNNSTEELKEKINNIENELNKLRNLFVNEFKKNNKNEIKIYLSKKDQK